MLGERQRTTDMPDLAHWRGKVSILLDTPCPSPVWSAKRLNGSIVTRTHAPRQGLHEGLYLYMKVSVKGLEHLVPKLAHSDTRPRPTTQVWDKASGKTLDERARGLGGVPRARSHCRVAAPLIRFIPYLCLE